MNAKQTIPVMAKLAPVLAAAGPGVLIGVAVGGALLWLFSREKEQPQLKPAEVTPNATLTVAGVAAAAVAPVAAPLPPKAVPQAKRVRREDVAEALEYGARRLTRQEAVAALQRLGFGKTAAYNALSEAGRFADLLEHSQDGLIQWNG